MWLTEHEIDLQTENLYKRRRPVVTIHASWFLITVIVLWVWLYVIWIDLFSRFFLHVHTTVDILSY